MQFDLKCHKGTIKDAPVTLEGLNYAVAEIDGIPSAVLLSICGKVCVVTSEDKNFTTVLSQFGYSTRCPREVLPAGSGFVEK